MRSDETNAPGNAKPVLTNADKRLIDFLVKQAIKQAVRSCT